MPRGDAVIFAQQDGPIAVHGRHHGWGSQNAYATVATAIAIRVAHGVVIEYDAPLNQYRHNGRIFTPALGASKTLHNGITFKQTAALSFTITFKQGTISVTSAGGAMPWLTFSAALPRSITQNLSKSMCGAYNRDYNQIVIPNYDLFSTPYDAQVFQWPGDQPVHRSDKTQIKAYRACKGFNGQAQETCVYDYTHTPKTHRRRLTKCIKRAHHQRAKHQLKVIAIVARHKKRYQRRVRKAIRRIIKKHPHLRRQVKRAHKKHIKKVIKRIVVKIIPVGVKKFDRKIKRRARKVVKVVVVKRPVIVDDQMIPQQTPQFVRRHGRRHHRRPVFRTRHGRRFGGRRTRHGRRAGRRHGRRVGRRHGRRAGRRHGRKQVRKLSARKAVNIYRKGFKAAQKKCRKQKVKLVKKFRKQRQIRRARRIARARRVAAKKAAIKARRIAARRIFRAKCAKRVAKALRKHRRGGRRHGRRHSKKAKKLTRRQRAIRRAKRAARRARKIIKKYGKRSKSARRARRAARKARKLARRLRRAQKKCSN
jgi:hypothetical protein